MVVRVEKWKRVDVVPPAHTLLYSTMKCSWLRILTNCWIAVIFGFKSNPLRWKIEAGLKNGMFANIDPNMSPSDHFISALQKSYEDDVYWSLKMSENKNFDDSLSSPPTPHFIPSIKSNVDSSKLQSVNGRLISIKGKKMCQLTLRFMTNDQTKNIIVGEQSNCAIIELLNLGFNRAQLSTASEVLTLNLRKKSNPLSMTMRNLTSVASNVNDGHDRQKKVKIPANAPFLSRLGITADDGRPKAGMGDKYRQIQNFVDILDSLVLRSMATKLQSAAAGAVRPPLRMIDMGSGMAYLTFAAHSHFSKKFQLQTIGVESREGLVQQTQKIAHDLGPEFDGLTFVRGNIEDFDINSPNAEGIANSTLRHSSNMNVDVLIALHACDTATDDALWYGIKNGVSVIVVSPCCQKEVRPQLDKFMSETATKLTRAPPRGGSVDESDERWVANRGISDNLAEAISSSPTAGRMESGLGALGAIAALATHGTFRERLAEMVTDCIRSLALELAGYETTVMEFVSSEHTARNTLIAAVKMGVETDDNINGGENDDGVGLGHRSRARQARQDATRRRLYDLLHTFGVERHRLVELMGERELLRGYSEQSTTVGPTKGKGQLKLRKKRTK